MRPLLSLLLFLTFLPSGNSSPNLVVCNNDCLAGCGHRCARPDTALKFVYKWTQTVNEGVKAPDLHRSARPVTLVSTLSVTTHPFRPVASEGRFIQHDIALEQVGACVSSIMQM